MEGSEPDLVIRRAPLQLFITPVSSSHGA